MSDFPWRFGQKAELAYTTEQVALFRAGALKVVEETGGCPKCARLRAEVADLTRKGKDLCSQQETAELMEDAARRRADALFAENARLRAALEAEAVEHERQAKVWSGEGEALAEYHRERAAMLRKTLAGGKEGKA